MLFDRIGIILNSLKFLNSLLFEESIEKRLLLKGLEFDCQEYVWGTKAKSYDPDRNFWL
jgi:hypothetical protein